MQYCYIRPCYNKTSTSLIILWMNAGKFETFMEENQIVSLSKSSKKNTFACGIISDDKSFHLVSIHLIDFQQYLFWNSVFEKNFI